MNDIDYVQLYIMTREQEAYLALLRAAVWGNKELESESVRGLEGERVNEIIHLAAFQGTGSLVFDQLLKLKDMEIPTALRMQMKQQSMMSMTQQNMMMTILTKMMIKVVTK